MQCTWLTVYKARQWAVIVYPLHACKMYTSHCANIEGVFYNVESSLLPSAGVMSLGKKLHVQGNLSNQDTFGTEGVLISEVS